MAWVNLFHNRQYENIKRYYKWMWKWISLVDYKNIINNCLNYNFIIGDLFFSFSFFQNQWPTSGKGYVKKFVATLTSLKTIIYHGHIFLALGMFDWDDFGDNGKKKWKIGGKMDGRGVCLGGGGGETCSSNK